MWTRKLYRRFVITILSLIVLESYSCKKDNVISESGVQPSLTVTMADGSQVPSILSISEESSTILFKVIAIADEWGYTISEDANWLSDEEVSDSSFSINSKPELTGEERTATITFWLKSYLDVRQVVRITQKAGEKIEIPLAEADLLDVVFNTDGSASDISPMKMEITKVSFDHPFTIESDKDLNRNVVDFNPPTIGGKINADQGSYYRIDYENKTEFKNNISDGASLEVLFKSNNDYTQNSVSGESKLLSSQQSGGGMLLQMTTAGHKPNANSISFNVYTNDDKVQNQGGSQIFIESDVQPNSTDWYHVIGVYDPKRGKSSIYVDGIKKNELETPGFFSFPVLGAQWFGIGVDAATSGADGAFGGKIAIARIYNRPLSDNEVSELWDSVKDNLN